MIIYNKLVRDQIPEIIKNKWKTPTTYIANDSEYWLKLKEKLQEEVDELLEETNIEEEWADVLEVIYAICDFKGISREQLESTRKQKAEERGGFKHHVILEKVE